MEPARKIFAQTVRFRLVVDRHRLRVRLLDRAPEQGESARLVRAMTLGSCLRTASCASVLRRGRQARGQAPECEGCWIPAFAGMSVRCRGASLRPGLQDQGFSCPGSFAVSATVTGPPDQVGGLRLQPLVVEKTPKFPRPARVFQLAERLGLDPARSPARGGGAAAAPQQHEDIKQPDADGRDGRCDIGPCGRVQHLIDAFDLVWAD